MQPALTAPDRQQTGAKGGEPEMFSQCELLFVYGTLRRDANHPAHSRYLQSASFVGHGWTAGCLYDLGPYPCMVETGGPDDRVRGEVYRLTGDHQLETIDRYEGAVEEDDESIHYTRRICDIAIDQGDAVRAWAYFYARPLPGTARRIESGDYVLK